MSTRGVRCAVGPVRDCCEACWLVRLKGDPADPLVGWPRSGTVLADGESGVVSTTYRRVLRPV
ncbi:hypothetical protein BRC68_16795 [Halobacteriales archaeon QH_6_64_20]|nr:MAG: hypothetical protein BRC68_16795 [Halobacteriales archaeon QH_6_64_20]